jgi:hypothetical protein
MVSHCMAFESVSSTDDANSCAVVDVVRCNCNGSMGSMSVGPLSRAAVTSGDARNKSNTLGDIDGEMDETSVEPNRGERGGE